jgi:tetratricopeptide (TPR) repeat protein
MQGDLSLSPIFFISRAGEDDLAARLVAHILESVGNVVILQNWNLRRHTSFIAEIQTALSSGARTVLLLSNDYLRKEYCEAEWQATIAGDPLNRRERLVVLKIADCAAHGLLRTFPYVNLSRLLRNPAQNAALLRTAVLAAIDPCISRRSLPSLDEFFYPARPILHEEIQETPHFRDTSNHLAKLDASLRAATMTALTQPVAAHGLGGVGKSTLARQYAWHAAQENLYAGIWWLNAERSQAGTFDGIERGLVELRRIVYPHLPMPSELGPAAREMLSHLSDLGAERPWLLIYDNVDDVQIATRGKWPVPANVRLLITSRRRAFPAGVTGIEVAKWESDDAASYLLEASARPDMTVAGAERVAQELGHLPLALSHAAAFFRENVSATPERYINGLTAHLNRVPETADYPAAVFATLRSSIASAERAATGAGAVFDLASLFAPDGIPEVLFRQEASLYPPSLRRIVADHEALDAAMDALGRFSLIDYRRADATFSVHRLAQRAARDRLTAERQILIDAAIDVLNTVHPGHDFAVWPQLERWLPHARAVAALAVDLSGARLALLLIRIGLHLKARGVYADAEPLFRRALTIRELAFGPDHPIVGTTLNHIAGLFEQQGWYSRAEPLFQRALQISEIANGPDHPAVGTAVNNLAGLYESLRQYDRAEPLYRRSLAICESALGPAHPAVATCLNNLAELYRAQRRYDLAEPLFQRTLRLFEKELGPHHPDVGTSLNNLAVLYRAQGRYDLAEPLYRRSLAIREAALGPDHPDVATSLNNLALLCFNQRRMEEASDFVRRALDISLKRLGPDHPSVKAIKANSTAIEAIRNKPTPLEDRPY